MKNYCPECGSEVAQNDIFCQYCGIALTPIQTGDISQPQTEPETASPAVIAVETPVITPLIKEEDAIPATPYVLSDEFQPPVAHLEELLNNPPPDEVQIIENKAVADLIDIQETDSNLEEVSDVLENVEVEKVADEVEETSAPIEIENQIAPIISQESPIIVDENLDSNENLNLILDSAELPQITEKTDDVIHITEEPNFDSTIPYVPADYVENNLQFSNSEVTALDKLTEYKEVIRNDSEVYEENELEKTTPPHSDMGVFPQVETIAESDSNAILEPLAVNLSESASDSTNAEIVEPIAESELPAQIENESDSIELPIIVAPPISTPTEKPIEQVNSAIEPASEKVAEGRAFTNPIGSEAGADTDGKNKTKLKPLEEGTVLNNRYEIIRKIGGGGMGAVYLASDRNLGGILRAVKEMVQSYIEEAQQDKAIADFKRESLLLTSLDHISIPTIFDYFYDDKEARFYLVMKYISGGDLSGKMRSTPEGRVDEVTVTDLAIQIADVLEYLHRHDPPIVYRDLKPSNIMIDGNSGKAMLIDFGIARWVNKEEKGVTAVGTMGYAPPELFSGNVEPRSDIYSLGSTMFHLLTGADPQSNPLLIFDFNKNPRPRQINSQLSDQIEQILMRAVEYNAAQRFTSAAEMRDALIAHLDNLKRGTVTFGVSVPTPGMPLIGNLPVFCGFCGQKILATDMFCPFCGAQQPLAGKSQNLPTQTPAYSGAKSTIRLMLIGTNELEQTEFNLEKDNNLIGRRDPMSNIFPEVDLSKYDPQTKISRKHARIWRENDGFLVEDLGSSNGTIIISGNSQSNRLLPRQPHALANGDTIRVGDTTLRFTIV